MLLVDSNPAVTSLEKQSGKSFGTPVV